MRLWTGVAAFLRERFPLEKMNLHDMVEKKTVPIHKLRWAYFLGGLTLLFFSILAVTGLIMLFYYEPTVSGAYDSVRYISHQVPGGSVIRNLHAWSSSCMIACVFLHLFTVFFMKAFVKPREITWLSGVILLFITFGFGFTGYLLPWHQVAVNATKVGLQSIGAIQDYLPGNFKDLPGQLIHVIQGGDSVGQATLSRFFVLHVVVLPVSILTLLGLHLLQIQFHGMSQGVDRPTGKSEAFFPDFIVNDLRVWAVFFVVMFIIALCIPFESLFGYPLLAPFDALGSTPDGIKPEWYFFFAYYPMELVPFWVILVATTVVGAVLFFTPWIFANTSRRTLRFLAFFAFLYLVVVTVFGEPITLLIKGH
ncbi:MAG: cytochrome bc complex cytochrome b subunit [Spirochaetes bacterium]|nr:cytochrome bc complex cytochrome b subunit [Spirochaetota bacterium]